MKPYSRTRRPGPTRTSTTGSISPGAIPIVELTFGETGNAGGNVARNSEVLLLHLVQLPRLALCQ
jgi:hypothetical protein